MLTSASTMIYYACRTDSVGCIADRPSTRASVHHISLYGADIPGTTGRRSMRSDQSLEDQTCLTATRVEPRNREVLIENG